MGYDAAMHSKPAALVPVTVDKPWGCEIWYSGIEARGESRVRLGEPRGLPATRKCVLLSRYLAEHGRMAPITLLKALQPSRGNLYLEVHETKCEVYIVDQVDAALWPEGGAVLLGANQQLRRTLGDKAFRERLAETARYAESQPGNIQDVEAFLARVALRSGDVVTIPPGVPHSLRRGVDVIEFQTPVFERKILAASQPVVTQNSWDCETAVATMTIEPAPKVAAEGEPIRLDSSLRGFSLQRLSGGSTATVPPWSVGWVAQGEVHAGGARFGPRTAFVTPVETRVSVQDDALAWLAAET